MGMATTPREKLAARLRTFDEYVENGEIDDESAEAIRELIRAYDSENIMVPKPSGEKNREPGTLMSWLYRLTVFARHRDLTTATDDELNGDVQEMLDGTHPRVKDEGLKQGTLRAYQAALRKFYGYHDYDVDSANIPLFDKEDTSVDPNDMLTREEIQEARGAAGNPRDRALFDLLLYTGQRREAIRTLRLKDVDVQAGTYRLNPEVDGLKGASDRNGKRPLLGAKGALQNWLEYHPAPNEPETYLITARPSYAAVDPFEPVSGETIRRVMADIKEKTDIKKPMHPHAMRHNFVTIAKRDHDLADDTIKYLIGHDPASNVMETTYAHLSGDDHVERAETAWGIREPEDDSPLTPDVCTVCGNPLEASAKACARCGAVYTPDAQASREQIQSDVKADLRETDPVEHADLQDKLDALDDLLEDPEIQAWRANQMTDAE